MKLVYKWLTGSLRPLQVLSHSPRLVLGGPGYSKNHVVIVSAKEVISRAAVLEEPVSGLQVQFVGRFKNTLGLSVEPNEKTL